MSGEEMPRRSFLELGGSIILLGAGQGGVAPQLEADPLDSEGDPTDWDVYGLVLEPSRPNADLVDAEWDTYRIVHLNPTTGEKAYLTHETQAWIEIPMPNPETQVDELRTAEFISFLDHTFARPNAPDTKNWDFTDADVTKVDSEIQLGGTTTLETTQRGNYSPGSEAVVGVAWRVDDTPTGGRGEAGYFDGTEGFGVGEDSTDSYVFILKDGTYERVHRSSWNGHDPGERVWQSDNPVITRFPHLWYGGGAVDIRALLHEDNQAKLRTLHTFTPDNIPDTFNPGPPFDQPNLPLRFETASLAGGNLLANAAHYEINQEEDETRVNGEHFNITGIGTSSWTPLLSWQKRTNWDMVNVKPLQFQAFAATNDLKLELQLGTVLSSPTFALPTHTDGAETAVEVEQGGTISTNGERRAVGSVAAGQGSTFGGSIAESLQFNLPADTTVTLAAQAVGGDADAFGHLEWREFF